MNAMSRPDPAQPIDTCNRRTIGQLCSRLARKQGRYSPASSCPMNIYANFHFKNYYGESFIENFSGNINFVKFVFRLDLDTEQ